MSQLQYDCLLYYMFEFGHVCQVTMLAWVNRLRYFSILCILLKISEIWVREKGPFVIYNGCFMIQTESVI